MTLSNYKIKDCFSSLVKSCNLGNIVVKAAFLLRFYIILQLNFFPFIPPLVKSCNRWNIVNLSLLIHIKETAQDCCSYIRDGFSAYLQYKVYFLFGIPTIFASIPVFTLIWEQNIVFILSWRLPEINSQPLLFIVVSYYNSAGLGIDNIKY